MSIHVAIGAFAIGLKDCNLIKTLSIKPFQGFNDTMNMTKTCMLANETMCL